MGGALVGDLLDQGGGLVEQSTGLVDLGVGLYLWWEGVLCEMGWGAERHVMRPTRYVNWRVSLDCWKLGHGTDYLDQVQYGSTQHTKCFFCARGTLNKKNTEVYVVTIDGCQFCMSKGPVFLTAIIPT
jgi:hypothetical protein